VVILWTSPLHAGELEGFDVTSVIVSPHLDDAALSAFFWMRAQSKVHNYPLVLDVFSRSDWWRFAGGAADPERVQRIREQEEHLAARLTGSRLQMLHLPEALLRGYTIDNVFQPPVHARDDAVRGLLAGLVQDVVAAHPRSHWFLPLGVGNHMDHVIARDETLAALERAGIATERIHLYEDLPYAAELAGAPDLSSAIPGRRLRLSATHAIGEEKFECLRVYWSQLTWSQIAKVHTYARRVGGGRPAERTWQLIP
jgi:LmbE family N-acetylglucosaminyl deacetylase